MFTSSNYRATLPDSYYTEKIGVNYDNSFKRVKRDMDGVIRMLERFEKIISDQNIQIKELKDKLDKIASNEEENVEVEYPKSPDKNTKLIFDNDTGIQHTDWATTYQRPPYPVYNKN